MRWRFGTGGTKVNGIEGIFRSRDISGRQSSVKEFVFRQEQGSVWNRDSNPIRYSENLLRNLLRPKTCFL